MSLTQERFEAIMSGQKMQARKIYDAIPKVDAWTVSQICAEVARIGNCGANHSVVEAVVNNLADAKLVTRIPGNRFRALPVKFKNPKSKPEANEEKEEAVNEAPVKTEAAKPAVAIVQPPAIDRLLHLADALNTTGKMLTQMSADLTDVADSITRSSEADQANLQRLRQLQDLLRGIGMASPA